MRTAMLHGVQQGDEDTGTGSADGMAQRNSAAVDVQLALVEVQRLTDGNSLRGIIKHLKGISDEAISEFNLPTAVPYVFEFDEGLNYAGDHFLGDPDEIARLMAAVANQGKKS